MNKIEIISQYNFIKTYHDKYLKHLGVKLPKLFSANNEFTKDALVLIFLSLGYPNTKICSKQDVTSFIRKFYPDVSDVQQARHLSIQKGWYILSGTRGDSSIPFGSYKLITLETPYPAYCKERREGFKGNFEVIKEEYNYRCATCGSKEGEEHLFRKGVKIQLQEGHMDPSKPLEEGNIIPQCQICNRPDRNKWIFDKTGRVIAVANTKDGIRIVKKFLKGAKDETLLEIKDYLNELLYK